MQKTNEQDSATNRCLLEYRYQMKAKTSALVPNVHPSTEEIEQIPEGTYSKQAFLDMR